MTLYPRLLALLSLCLISPGHGAQAHERSLSSWSHGAWSVDLLENAAFGYRSCRVSTGGDGSGTLALRIGEGGADATFSYTPVWFRGMAPPLHWDDKMALIFDGQPSPMADKMEIVTFTDAGGESIVDAALSNGYVADTVGLLRASNTVIVAVGRDGVTSPYDTYLLTGFTATWLKAAEWCGFDPAKRFSPS